MTLGLVIDGKGFPKTSKVFSGNQSEPKTLLGMIDAGIATEENLSELIADFVHKKGCTKNYQKVCERIGRLEEKYSRISRFYNVRVEEKNGLTSKITWEYIKDQSDQRFSGSYYLRTDRTDLSEKQIWNIYTMLNE